MAGDPRNYPDWEKWSRHSEAREQLHDSIARHKKEHGRFPWQKKCDLCDEIATICVADGLEPNSRRVSLCAKCANSADPETGERSFVWGPKPKEENDEN